MLIRRIVLAGFVSALLLGPGLIPVTRAAATPPRPPAEGTAKPGGAASGVIPWTRLQKVRLVEDNNKTQPEFDASVASLDGQEVMIEGFIMPLDQGEKQKHFLLSAYPQSCPFCSPFGPEGLVEIISRQAVPLTFKAVRIKGKFSLLRNYDESGLFYRLTDASVISP